MHEMVSFSFLFVRSVHKLLRVPRNKFIKSAITFQYNTPESHKLSKSFSTRSYRNSYTWYVLSGAWVNDRDWNLKVKKSFQREINESEQKITILSFYDSNILRLTHLTFVERCNRNPQTKRHWYLGLCNQEPKIVLSIAWRRNLKTENIKLVTLHPIRRQKKILSYDDGRSFSKIERYGKTSFSYLSFRPPPYFKTKPRGWL